MTSKKQEKRNNKLIALGISILLAITMIPFQVFIEKAEAITETRTVTWKRGEPQPVVPQTIIGANGQTLTLENQSQPVAVSAPVPVSQVITHEDTKESTVKDDPNNSPGQWLINKDGFSGYIPRVKIESTLLSTEERRTDRTTTRTMDITVNTTTVPPSASIGEQTIGAYDERVLSEYIKNYYGTVVNDGVTYKFPGGDGSIAQGPRKSASAAGYNQEITITYYCYETVQKWAVKSLYSGTLSKTIGAGEQMVTLTYSAPDDPNALKTSYVVHYYKEGTTEELAPAQQIVDQPINTEITVAAIDITGYELIGEKEVKITLAQQNNEVNFFYRPAAQAVAENTNTNTNTSTADNASQTSASTTPDFNEEQEDDTLPIIPIVIAIVLVGVVAAAVIIIRRKKNAADNEDEENANETKTSTDNTNLDEFDLDNDSEYDTFSIGEDFETSSIDASTLTEGALFDDYTPESQLIEVVPTEVEDEDGNMIVEYEQTPKADIEIIPSIAEDIPTILYLPSMLDEEGNRIATFTPAENAQYWIAIDEETAKRAVSKEIIVASNECDEIFRGSLIDENDEITQQLMLDSDLLVASLNNELEEGQTQNILEELDEYEIKTNQIIDEQRLSYSKKQNKIEMLDETPEDEFSNLDDEFEFVELDNEDDDLDDNSDFIKDTEDDVDDDEFEFIEISEENEEDQLDIEDTTDNISDFEKEMEDFDYFDDFAEPDVDEGYEGEYENGFSNRLEEIINQEENVEVDIDDNDDDFNDVLDEIEDEITDDNDDVDDEEEDNFDFDFQDISEDVIEEIEENDDNDNDDMEFDFDDAVENDKDETNNKEKDQNSTDTIDDDDFDSMLENL